MARAACLLAAVAAWRADAFPIDSLSVSQEIFNQLNASTGPRDGLATSALLPALQKLFEDTKYGIEVEKGDVVISAAFPDTSVDDSCDHKIDALSPHATGTLKGDSSLRFGIANVSWTGVTVFADARVDASLDIGTDVRVRVGKKIFGHHCSELLRKTMGIDVLSDGNNAIGINMTAFNAHIAKVNGTWSLVFNFHAAIVGRVMTWNVEKVTADGCKIKIAGIEIASVCGIIERHVKDAAQKLTNQVTMVEAPKLLSKLEQKLNTLIGSEVVIPLRIGEEAAAESTTRAPAVSELVV